MLEVGVAAVREAAGWSRARSATALTISLLALGLPSALSYSAAELRIDGIRFLDLMDETVGTLDLPVTALLLAAVFTWFLPPGRLAQEIGPGTTRLVHPLCRVFIPLVLVITTATRLVSGLDFPSLRSLPDTEVIRVLFQVEGTGGVLALLVLILAGLLSKQRLIRRH